MAYVGRGTDKISNIELLDAITFTNSAGPYNITKDLTAFVPTASNALVISIDGVVQDPGSYTTSVATITFDSSMSSASTMNFMYQIGTGLITAPSDDSVTTAKLANLSVTAAKIATDAVETAKIKDLNVTNDKIAAGTIDVTAKITGVVPTANLGSGTASSTTILYGDQTYKTEPAEYDDSVLQSNVAMLGFKVAVNGSLTRYNLVDQSIDEFFDTSGVDASASTNERRVASGSNYYYDGATTVTPTITEDADDTGTDGDYSWYKWTDTAGTGSYNTNTTQDHEWLVVAGGGGGGGGNHGGGAAGGGYRTGTTLSLIGGNTYTVTVGAGGAGGASGANNTGATGSESILSGTGITTITSTGGGGGGSAGDGADGGSGGGAGANSGGQTELGGSGNTPAITQYTAAGETTTVQGYDGGGNGGYASSRYPGGGGGGAGAVGQAAQSVNVAGAGAAGVNSSITGATVGYAGGGGGGIYAGGTAGTATHGGGAGGLDAVGANGTVNTGGGGGGGNGGAAYAGGNGGSGVLVLRRLTTATTGGQDLTLQSTDVTAEAQPTYGEFVTLIENASGTATLNTDIKGYISRDSGTTFTQGTLVDEGTWGTNKQILGFHDLDISSQPSGTSMCYKIETLNQSASVKETRIYASSIGWR